MLELCQPDWVQSELRTGMSSLQHAVTDRRAYWHGVTFIVATLTFKLKFANPVARQCLRRFFPRARNPRLLPEEIRDWLTTDHNASCNKSLITRVENESLFVRRVKPEPVDAIPLLLEVVNIYQTELRRKHRGVTMREAEVLHWVAAGKTNREIAQIVGSAPATVGKHLEHIYLKLGVETRTAAISLLRDSDWR